MKSKSGKPTKKISLLAILVALICMTLAVSVMANEAPREKGDACYTKGDLNGDGEVTKSDAIYLLYHSINPEAYPLAQSGNFDNDNEGKVSGSDALALFKTLITGEKQVVHLLQETPEWTWVEEGNSVQASALYICACGKDEYSATITYGEGTKDAPTCTKNGSLTHVATTDLGDKAEYTVALQATGHAIDPNVPACQKQTCGNGCGYVKAAEKHTLSATFTEQAVVDKACTFKEVFTCTACGDPVDGKEYVKHTYASKLTKEATCSQKGEKTYTCTVCENHSYTEEVALVEDAHTWDAGSTDTTTGIVTYKCKETGCDGKKTAIVAVVTDNKATAAVKGDALKSTTANELEFKDAAIKLDDSTKNTLGALTEEKDINISVETTTADALNITADQKAQIGNNTVYDFSMTAGNTAISQLGGAITITVPYTLQDGDDVDCIDIWFVNDNGKVEVVKGKYNNGYVTFTTNHFSYYTVTRLTPAERCAAYGHVYSEKKVDPTCENDGYISKACTRCGHTEKTKNGDKLGHNYKVVSENKVTCTEAGFKKEECQNCKHVIETVTSAAGHDYAAATEVKATCETRGYNSKKCKNEGCTNEDIQYTSAVAGHAYEAVWTWDEEKLTASVELSCKRTGCQSAAVKADAVVSIQKQIAATCADEGYVLYAAAALHNGESYTDTHKVIEKQLQHKVTNEWKYNKITHYKECTMCGGKVNEADHTLGAETVVVEPTCTTGGSKTASCSCGYVHTTELAALGHNVVDEDCTRCDFTTNTCNHDAISLVQVDMSKYCDVEYGEPAFVYTTCECGRNATLNHYEIYCDMDMKVTYTTDKNGYAVEHRVGTCKDCGLTFEEETSWEVSSGCVGTSYKTIKLTDKDGTVIVNFDGVFSKNVEHPQVVYGETKELTEIGLCSGTATPTACACGKYKSTNIADVKCEYTWLEDECVDNKNVLLCEECGIKLVGEYEDKELDKCHYLVEMTQSYYRGETKLASYDMVYVETWHDCDYTTKLTGTKCNEGYYVTADCKNCNYKETDYCMPESCEYAAQYKEIDVSKYNLCTDTMGVSVCPCGGYSRVWNDGLYEAHEEVEEIYEYSEEDGYDTCHVKYSCENCDLVYEQTEIYRFTEDSCEVKYSTKAEYRVNNKVIFAEHYTEQHESHRYEMLSFHLNGDSCEDGGYIVYACRECGEAFTNEIDTEWGHPNSLVGSYNLADYGMCGGTVEMYSCPCGEEQWIHEYAEEGEGCQWAHYSYDFETETSIYKCTECGIYRQRTSENELIEGCLYKYTEKYDYMNDYEILLSAKVVRETYNHNDKYSFELFENGKTCSDGFKVTATCQKCNDVRSWTDWAPEGEHWTFGTANYDLADYGYCGGRVWFYECPCGEEKGVGYDIWGYCEWDKESYDEKTGLVWNECRVCQGRHGEAVEKLYRENCMQYEMQTHIFIDADGKEVLNFKRENQYPSHNLDITFEFEGEKDCEAGYKVVEDCKDCDYTNTYFEKGYEEWHYTYVIERIDVGSKGLCDGDFVVSKCPCGEETYAHLDNNCDMRMHSEDYQNNTWSYKCDICGGTEVTKFGKEIVVGCTISRERTLTYYNKDGEVVHTYVRPEQWDEHDYEVLSYSVVDGNCMNGYTETLKCRECAYTITRSDEGHETKLEVPYALAGFGVCNGTTIVNRSCYCGQYESAYIDYESVKCNFDYKYETPVIDGQKHEIQTEECRTCGLKVVRDRARQIMPNCMSQDNVNMIITVKGTLIDSVFYTSMEPYHDSTYTYTLKPGATSCDDGINVTQTCKNCNNVWTYDTYGHEQREVAGTEIDLAQYGSNCGAYLVETACVCGEYNGYQVKGQCDVGYQYITPWLGQYYEDQETTEGWVDPVYGAWDVKCAVTDPACGLYMRKCEYSVLNKDTCTMTEYTVWQLGYDAKTGTCQKEIVLEGDSYAYHTYESTYTSEELEDGGKNNINTGVCHCGTKVVRTSTYNANDEWVAHRIVITNGLNNGENSLYDSGQSTVRFADYDYVTEWYKEMTSPSGEVEWVRCSYKYDWDNFDCTRVVTYTDSSGKSHSETESYHQGGYVLAPGQQQSCTQPALHYYGCKVCNKVNENDAWVQAPYGHYYENGKCTRCGLESANGADGSIVLEDFTAKYGNGTNYVIGYWNRGNIQFLNNVSIVDANGNVTALGNLTFTVLTYEKDGINAVSVSIADVEAAAKAAGVTGDVRIAFVPAGGGSNLDYAITLTK